MLFKSFVRPIVLITIGIFVATSLCFTQSEKPRILTAQDILKWSPVPSDHRIAYGSEPLQFGDLRLPKSAAPYPVAIIIHGGCWYSEYNLDHIGNLCATLTRAGVATWSLEYRRIGDEGGGFPGTFEDVARGTDYLRTLAKQYPLDLQRVVVIGHSAGGQLALWLAARHRLPKDSSLVMANPLQLQGVVSLAGITDLQKYRPNCGDAVTKLMGGSPEKLPERYKETSPLELLPVGVAQRLIHGTNDSIVPLAMVQDYAAAAKSKGDDVTLSVIADAGHFELIDPKSSAWSAVEKTVLSLVEVKKANQSNQIKKGSTNNY